MAKKYKRKYQDITPIHCACLIHDTLYDFSYVDKLYRSLCRNLSRQVILHVFTESNRTVPEPYIKHDLIEWPGIRGPKKSWWYKVQIFNDNQYSGHLLYFDLDVVILKNIDWIWKLSPHNFWAVRDFRYLFRPARATLNSSIMWFDTTAYGYVYNEFDVKTTNKYHGDQEYIHSKVVTNGLHYLDTAKIKSYKWEVKEGGFDFSTRKYLEPGKICYPDDTVDILIFHGNPKPHSENSPVIKENWV